MKKTIAIFLILMMAVSMMSFHATAAQTALYVSPDGSDANAGTIDAPLKTVAAAKERLKALKGALGENEKATVWLRGGRYEFDDTLSFTAEDLPNVTYAAYNGEEVVFSGAKEITGFHEETVNGVRTFVKHLDTTDPAGFKSLFREDAQLPVARYPETGYFTVKKTAPEDDLWTEKNTPWSMTLGQRSFYADPADLAVPFTNPTDVQVRILHYWHDELMFLTGVDRATGKLSLSRPSAMMIRDIDRYYFENVFEAMNEPGEWYLNNETNTLYYVPQAGETADACVLRASALERLVEIDGVSGVTFDHIRFTETDWTVPSPGGWWAGWRYDYDIDAPQAALDVRGVVEVNHAENISFINCEFTNLGASGVKFMNGVKHSRVDSCLFRNIAATGIFVGGANCLPEEPDCTADITVTNNLVSGYGRKFFCAIGIQVTYCDGAEISHNEITDGYYTAISDGWVWGYAYQLTNHIMITDNLVYNIGQGWLSDMGGVYTLGIQPGTVIRGNVFHNIAADPGEGGYGGWGVYLDEGSSQITVEKNLVYACGSDGYHLHYGADNTVRNNIFALSAEAQIRVVSRYEHHKTADFTDNIILTDGKTPVFSHVEKATADAFTAQNNILWDVTNGDKIFLMQGSEADDAMSLATARRKGIIGDNIVADPQFVDPLAFDFTLKETSPALQNGFESWDYSAAGTLPGTVIGLTTEGGQTAYNDHAAAQTPGGSRVKLAFFKEWINRLAARLQKLLRMLGIKETVC